MTALRRTDADHHTPKVESEFYSEITLRNRHFIPMPLQLELKEIKVLLAGCGTIGGACTVPFARAGVQNFWICEPDIYELNNLNRQPASCADLGHNKGRIQAERILSVNPYAKIKVEEKGIHDSTVYDAVEWADFIIDGVDITTRSGIEAKILLHEIACERSKPVVSGLDLGFCQLGFPWAYHKNLKTPLNGAALKARKAQNPLKSFFLMMPLNTMPLHSMEMLLDGLEGKSVSQLGLAGDLMSAAGITSLIRFLSTGELVGWNINLGKQAMGINPWIKASLNGLKHKRKIKKLLAQMP